MRLTQRPDCYGRPKESEGDTQDGISTFTNTSKHGRALTFTIPPKPRVLDYLRTFAPLAKDDVMQ
jgi:hypothetical protein